MRLSNERIHHLARMLSLKLQEEGRLVVADEASLVQALEESIATELSVEDRLNMEVRELMKTYADEIERGRVDYHKMFTMIKRKLVQDRGIVL